MPLAYEHRRQACSQGFLHGREQVRFVVDHDIVVRRLATLDVIEAALLVQVDEHLAGDRVPDPRALDLAWLENDIAVRQHDRSTHGCQMSDGLAREREQQRIEWVLEQEIGHPQQARVFVEPGPECLQTLQVIGAPQLDP